MLGYIILIITMVIGIGLITIAGLFSKKYQETIGATGAVLFIVSMVISVILLIGSIVSWYDHAQNIGTIRSANYAIAVQSERCDRLKQFLYNIPSIKNGTVVLNNDTPYKALIDQLAVAESDLAASKQKIADARVDIAQRQVGPYWFIVNIMGKE